MLVARVHAVSRRAEAERDLSEEEQDEQDEQESEVVEIRELMIHPGRHEVFCLPPAGGTDGYGVQAMTERARRKTI